MTEKDKIKFIGQLLESRDIDCGKCGMRDERMRCKMVHSLIDTISEAIEEEDIPYPSDAYVKIYVSGYLDCYHDILVECEMMTPDMKFTADPDEEM